MSSTPKWSPKDPQDIRDYWIDFTSLLGTGETITAETVAVAAEQNPVTDPYTDLTKIADDFDTPLVRVRLAGGTPAIYAVDFHITTSTGQQFDLTKTLSVKERTA